VQWVILMMRDASDNNKSRGRAMNNCASRSVGRSVGRMLEKVGRVLRRFCDPNLIGWIILIRTMMCVSIVRIFIHMRCCTFRSNSSTKENLKRTFPT